ncbi:prepilin-type N-terminal cleavage/methylation domain-containing protein [Candidatus Sumerlaeota bacterium]|nr:prepilin-type N-terminal cleavage/methylation domain-containing protein [Candidatus Sumerlaeota bacterium]
MVSSARRYSGFTLIEAVIVVTVLAILGLLAIPVMDSALTEARLSAGVDEVTAAVEFAQMSALGGGRSCRVTVDAPTDYLEVEQSTCDADFLGGGAEIPADEAEAESYVTAPHLLRSNGLYEVAFANESHLEQVDIVETTLASGGNTIVFDALGIPSTGGGIVLRCGAMEATLNIDASTGKVDLTE